MNARTAPHALPHARQAGHRQAASGASAPPGLTPLRATERAPPAVGGLQVQHHVPQTLPSSGSEVGVVDLTAQLSRARAEVGLLHQAIARAGAEEASARAGLARLSHDLRTPLAAIVSWCSVLQQRKPDAALLRAAVHAIERNAQRQAQLLDRALEHSQAPQLSRPSDDAQPAALLPSGTTTRLDDTKVLLVDDDSDVREGVSRALRAAGAVVFVAGDAREALALLRVERPQVLVCDIEMPEIDGHQLLERIRRLSATAGGAIPALALTGLDTPSQGLESIRAGFQRHLRKGVSQETLLQAIRGLAPAQGQNSR